MATAKKSRITSKPQPKTLKLVCKCGDCTHWEVLIGTETKEGRDMLKCMSCSLELPCYFSTQPHEGVHWEKQGRNER